MKKTPRDFLCVDPCVNNKLGLMMGRPYIFAGHQRLDLRWIRFNLFPLKSLIDFKKCDGYWKPIFEKSNNMTYSRKA